MRQYCGDRFIHISAIGRTMPQPNPSRTVTTVETAFEIIECLKVFEEATAPEIAEELELATSTAHDHLVTLESLGMLIKKANGYEIGLRFLDFGTFAKAGYPIFELSAPTLERLANKTGEFVWLYIEEHGRVMAIAREKGEKAVRSSRLGRPLPMHSTAGGKAILANYSEEHIQEIVDRHGLEPDTDHTITDLNELFAELEQIQQQGYAVNDEESKMGLRAIGGAITHNDEVLGAISVPGPKHRLTDSVFENEFPEYVLEAINEIELNVGPAYERNQSK